MRTPLAMMAAALLLAACNPPPPSAGPDPIEMMMVGRMMNPQPAPVYQMRTQTICSRLGNTVFCN